MMSCRPLILDAFLPYRLSVASNAVSTRISNSYRRRFGLKVAEWRVLAILAESPRLAPQALVGATRMDKISISRAATALGERGLIAIQPNRDDRRSHFLALTDEGRALYAEIVPAALDLETRLLDSFSAEECAQLAALLRRIEAAAESEL